MAATHVTDGGLGTDLILHHGVDLPEFAAYPLLAERPGRALLSSYYEQYAAIAARADAGLVLETPTWRANPDWGALPRPVTARVDDRTSIPPSARGLHRAWPGSAPARSASGSL